MLNPENDARPEFLFVACIGRRLVSAVESIIDSHPVDISIPPLAPLILCVQPNCFSQLIGLASAISPAVDVDNAESAACRSGEMPVCDSATADDVDEEWRCCFLPCLVGIYPGIVTGTNERCERG